MAVPAIDHLVLRLKVADVIYMLRITLGPSGAVPPQGLIASRNTPLFDSPILMSSLDGLSSPSTLPDYPDVDQPSCQLMGRTGLIVQALMGLMVILSLVYKRHRETPKRPWRIWLFDVSKQIVGQLFVHTANLLVSGLVSHHTSSNACVSYFLNILIDTTFGIVLIYYTLHALTNLFTEKLQMKGFESGVYGTPPSFNFWARQAALYVLALSTMKAVVITILFLFPAIYKVGEWLLSWTWTGDGDAFQVVFVMGIFPIIMNVLQFWLIDSIVKAQSAGPVSLDIEQGNPEDREPLFNAPDDDDEDASRAQLPPISRRSFSLESRQSHDNHSFATDATTVTNPEEHKSTASSSRRVVEAHEYPPSLSSSFSSNASSPSTKPPREAKNLQRKSKRREPLSPLRMHSTITRGLSSPLSPSGDANIPSTPSPTIAPAVELQDRGEWADAWEDSHEWDKQGHEKQASLTMDGEWNPSHAMRTAH